MEAIAKTKYLKGSPRKARLVIDLIRGVNVSRALSILKFTDKRAAQPIAKCLNSAIANATNTAEKQNIAIDPDDLWIKSCFVDMGPHKNRRRVRPAPQGRAYREQRHYCHITIEVTSEEKAKTEKELLAEASMAKRPMGKKLAAKAAAKEGKKETKQAKSEKVKETETPEPVETLEAAESVESTETVETVEATTPEAVETAEATDAADETATDPAPADEVTTDEPVSDASESDEAAEESEKK